MHPPADQRCQIYITGQWAPEDASFKRMVRCSNPGDHWVAWGGCDCGDPTSVVCESDFYSWECPGTHTFGGGSTHA